MDAGTKKRIAVVRSGSVTIADATWVGDMHHRIETVEVFSQPFSIKRNQSGTFDVICGSRIVAAVLEVEHA